MCGHCSQWFPFQINKEILKKVVGADGDFFLFSWDRLGLCPHVFAIYFYGYSQSALFFLNMYISSSAKFWFILLPDQIQSLFFICTFDMTKDSQVEFSGCIVFHPSMNFNCNIQVNQLQNKLSILLCSLKKNLYFIHGREKP